MNKIKQIKLFWIAPIVLLLLICNFQFNNSKLESYGRMPASTFGICFKSLYSFFDNEFTDDFMLEVFQTKISNLLTRHHIISENIHFLKKTETFVHIPDMELINKELAQIKEEIKIFFQQYIQVVDIGIPGAKKLKWSSLDFYKLENVMGKMNKGIYTDENNDFIIKITSATDDIKLRELYWLTQLEKLGGAKLHFVGYTKDGSLFFVMENLFSGSKIASFKEIKFIGGTDKMISKLANDQFKNTFISEISANFQKMIKNNIIPADPDFIISSNGHIGWIDTAVWRKAKSPKDVILILDYISRTLEKNLNYDFTSEIMDDLFTSLRKKKTLSTKEIDSLQAIQKTCPCLMRDIIVEF